VATSIVATFSLGSSTLAEQSGGWREHCHGTGSCRASTPRASVHSFMPQTTTQVFFVSTSSNLQGGYDVEADYLCKSSLVTCRVLDARTMVHVPAQKDLDLAIVP